MGKFVAGFIGGYVAHKIVVSMLQYEASQGDEEAKNLVDHNVEIGARIHDILK